MMEPLIRFLLILSCLIINVNSTFSQTQFWQQTNGPYGGYIYDIAKDSIGNLYVAAGGGGVFISTNQGDTWSQLAEGMDNRLAEVLAFDDNGTLYVGTFNGNLYRLKDLSSKWEEIFYDTSIPIENIVINKSGIIAAGGCYDLCDMTCPEPQLFFSTNLGNQWTEIPLPRKYMLTFTMNSNNWLFVISDGCMYRSSNFGGEWHRINFFFPHSLDNKIVVNKDDNLLFLTAQGLYRSTDNGDNWSLFGPGSYAIDINDKGDIYTAGPGGLIFRTTDCGGSWTRIDSLGTFIFSILSYSDSTIFIDDHFNEGLFKTTDLGDTWNLVGVQSTNVNSLYVDWQGNIYAGTDRGLYKTTDRGNKWSHISDIQGNIVYSSPDGKLVILAWNSLLISEDNGRIWRHMLPATGKQVYTVYHRRNGQWLISFWDSSGIWYSKDDGHSWQSLGLHKWVLSIETYGGSDIFAGTMNNGVYRSTDNGASWYQNDNILCSLSVNKLVVHPSGTLIATTYNTFYRSTDFADSWSLIDTAHINDIVLNNEGKIFAGTQYGVIYSPDTGVIWTEINGGLTTLRTNCLAVDSNSCLYAGTSGSGVFRSTQMTTDAQQFTGIIPNEFLLEHNYPNPFNPLTQITYSIPNANKVTLKIYDVLGREVVVLVNERKQPGEYKVTWNAEGVPSGVYFYRIVAGEFVETKKMVVVK